ncbi:MAG TPA: PAS domain-containing protein [Thermoanaerobaculia bacterium]|nr:PAS domain-containing protein [Thermoanaerobaculia bacterium]
MLALTPITRRYLELLDALQQSAIATTADGVIVDWNRSAESLYGWRRDEALGRNVVDVTPAAVSREEASRIMSSLAAGEIWSGEFPVRTRSGESFIASVTDVPIVDERDHVVAVVGLSAPSRAAAPLATVLTRFSEACASLWPGRVKIAFGRSEATVPGTEPHILQLFALLLLRYAKPLESGESVDVSGRAADASLFADFGIRGAAPAAYLRFGASPQRAWSVVRDEINGARPTNFASALVRRIGGWLFVESSGNELQTTHLLLPLV